MSGNGMPPPDGAEKSLGEVVQEVSEKASLLVREEIALAKAEVTAKIKSIARGTVAGLVAGVFLVFGVVMLLFWLAFFLNDLFNFGNVWQGFGIVTVLLFVLGALAGYLALRSLSRGSPPTPDLAIEEAKRTREAFEHPLEGDQAARSLEAGSEVKG